MLTHIGNVHTKLGEYPIAQTYYEQALALTRITGDRHGEGTNLSHLGWVYAKLGRNDDALRHLREALTVLDTLDVLESLWQVHRRLGFVEDKLAHVDASLTHYNQAIATIEAVRAGLGETSYKLSFIQDKLEVYDEFLTLLYHLHGQHPDKKYAHQALEVFERKQARVFLEEIGQSGARRFRGLPDSIVDEETRLLRASSNIRALIEAEQAKPKRNLALIQDWEAQLANLKAERQRFEQRLHREYPGYYALKYPRPVAPDELLIKVVAA